MLVVGIILSYFLPVVIFIFISMSTKVFGISFNLSVLLIIIITIIIMSSIYDANL